MVLSTIRSPQDLRGLSTEAMVALAAEIRTFLIDAVSRTGGHLGPNLGVVELTLAIHRVFNSPHDSIVFDTGHQTYVHKLLTGRQDFATLRSAGGLSGYPDRQESDHDVVQNSHATTAVSWGEGIARARRLQGETDRHVVAVIGDGALTGGMAWEALNNVAADPDLPLVVVVNDNERSYAPTTGGMARHLATLRTTRGYERFLSWGKHTLGRTPVVGGAMYETLHGMKKGIKDIVAPQGLFEDLGLKYLGPVDGHDIQAVETALRRARNYGGPVIVHVITEKGHGYAPALAHDGDRFHAVGRIDVETGESLGAAPSPSWTSIFADEMVQLGRQRDDLVGVTAAMCIPVGLHRFAAAYPDRVIDVGIAEQHAATMAAGLAFGGVHPVVAVYSTFLNRAFDQVLMDVALHRAGVTFVLDRAGITGPDGPSHHGMWDMSLLQLVPGIRIAAPRDADQLRAQLQEAVQVADGPTVVRFPRGAAPQKPIPAVAQWGTVDVLHLPPRLVADGLSGEPGSVAYNSVQEQGNARDSDVRGDVLIVAVGSLAGLGVEVAQRLVAHGMDATVIDPRWVIPVNPAIVDLAAQYRLMVTVEDNLRIGGVGAQIAQELRDRSISTPVVNFGLPAEFVPHGGRAEILADYGLTAQAVTRRIVEELAHADGVTTHISAVADGPIH
ncbi:MAG: 1-deoxy-D-xylulose-5-phosphate synthase [Actinomycetota bacterium]